MPSAGSDILIDGLNLGHPLLPIAAWRGFTSVTGDGAGESADARIQIRSSTFKPPGAYWNIEQLSPRIVGGAADVIGFRVDGAEVLMGGTSQSHRLGQSAILAGANIGRGAVQGSDLVSRAVQQLIFKVRGLLDNSTTTTSVSALFNSNTNLQGYDLYASGFLWSNSVLQYGWPIRPQDGPSLMDSAALRRELERLRR